ncbi:MAG: hypothetical protein ABL908_01425 [Hyphomicrobium sp.]
MTRHIASTTNSLLTWILCGAVLASFIPFGGKVQGKPAGVRTAIELLGKKVRLDQGFSANGLKFVSRS